MAASEPNETMMIWAVSDGRAGLRNQVLGLAEAIARRTPAEITDITVDLRAPWRWLPPRLVDLGVFGLPFRALTSSRPLVPPWPDLFIGCGRRSLPLSLAVRRLSHGRTFTVQTQDPRLAPSAFDLVVPPIHDDLTGDNVFPILGSPNRLQADLLAEEAAALRERLAPLALQGEPTIAVLIGGASRHHRFAVADAAALGAQLKSLAQNGARLLVTTSRRTGAPQTEELRRALKGKEKSVWVWDGTGDNPYFGLLGLADFILLTEDSVNMATEAAVTGKPIYTLAMPGGSAKHAQFHDSLRERGITRRFNGEIAPFAYAPLDETARAADEVTRRAHER